tara:strand:+ start:20 stop:2134 length:2115 start_codon:yes stop_codon:yes gene_type:complete
MASCENKYTTLLDLSRQAKVITGETACFDGKIEVGIPFSGYPTGVDTGTTVSLGVVSSETAVFSGNTGTTVFDVSNTGSTNYNALFSGYSGTVWTNALFSGNTSGLTLPITTLSADTQIVGPVWTLTQTATTSNGEHIIGIQYTGYTITYAFSQLEQLSVTAYTAYSGFSSASQENFSAGTLDYKGPLDYISTKEDATVDGILTTKKLTVTDGASASTIGYVLTQLDEDGRAGWVYNGSSSGTTFTGNTSGTCITDLYLTNLYGCSPLHIEPSGLNDVYMVENGGSVGIGTITPSDGQLHIDGDSTVSRGLYVETDYSGNGVSEGIRVLNWTTSTSNPLFPTGGLIWGRASGQNRYSYGLIGASGFAAWTNIQVMMGVRGVAGVSLSSNIDAYGIWGESIISNSGDNIGGYFIAENPGAGNNYAIIVPPSGGTVGIGTETPTESLHIEGGNILVSYNQDTNTKLSIKNDNGTNDAKSVLNFFVSGSSLPGSAVGSIQVIGPDSVPTGTFMGSYLPNSMNITTSNLTTANRMHINIGSRRGSDAQTRFFGGSDDFDSSSLLGIFYTSGLTITDMVNTDTLRVRSGSNNGHVLTSDADGVGTWQSPAVGVTTTVDAASDPNVSNIDVVFYTASIAGGTIYLNSTMNQAGYKITIIRTSTTAAADIGGTGGALINGSATKALPTAVYSTTTCISDGTDWYCTRGSVI